MSKKLTVWIVVAIIISVLVTVCIIVNPIGIKIINLEDKIDYAGIFDDADEIEAVKGDIHYSLSYDVDIAEIREQFEKLRVKDKQITHNDKSPPDNTNCIIVGSNSLYFSKDFSEFCGHWGPDSAYQPSYKILNPQVAEKVFDLISNSESTRINKGLKVTDIRTGSYLTNVSVSVKSLLLEDNKHCVKIEMKNDSDKQYSYGIGKNLYYKQDDELILCRTFKNTEDRRWGVNAVAQILMPNDIGTMEYSFYLDDVTREGIYRLETEALWVEFELKK